MVLLAERVDDSGSFLRALALWNTDRFEPIFEYDSRKGPCEEVLDGQDVYVRHGAQDRFPDSQTIQRFGVQGYFGTPLLNSKGEVIGHLAILDQKPLILSSQEQSLIQVFFGSSWRRVGA